MYIGPVLPSLYVTVEKNSPWNNHEVKILFIRKLGEQVVVRLVDSFTPKQWIASVCFPVGPNSKSCLSLKHIYEDPARQRWQRLSAYATEQKAYEKYDKLFFFFPSSKFTFG